LNTLCFAPEELVCRNDLAVSKIQGVRKAEIKLNWDYGRTTGKRLCLFEEGIKAARQWARAGTLEELTLVGKVDGRSTPEGREGSREEVERILQDARDSGDFDGVLKKLVFEGIGWRSSFEDFLGGQGGLESLETFAGQVNELFRGDVIADGELLWRNGKKVKDLADIESEPYPDSGGEWSDSEEGRNDDDEWEKV
jgi:hypothetical protein